MNKGIVKKYFAKYLKAWYLNESDLEFKSLVRILNKKDKAKEELKDMYKECFEIFIPSDKWDEATLFLSTYGSGLAKELAKKEK